MSATSVFTGNYKTNLLSPFTPNSQSPNAAGTLGATVAIAAPTSVADRNHDVGVGRAPVHHPGTATMGIGGQASEHLHVRRDDHDVRPALRVPL